MGTVEGAVIRWALIALLGLAVAALVSLSASALTSQSVGLSSEPLTAGEQLAPSRTTVTRTVTRTVTTPRSIHTSPPAEVPSDDHHHNDGDGDDDD